MHDVSRRRNVVLPLVILVSVCGGSACLPLRVAVGAGTAGSESTSSSESTGPVPMPPLRGVGLREGVDALAALGITDVTPVPVDGHMFVLRYDNWVVQRQAPPTGSAVTGEDEVVLSVRKTEEAESRFCFDGDC